MKIERYNDTQCILGEGLFLHKGTPYWVDILDNKLFIGLNEIIKLDFIPSCVLFADDEKIIIAGDIGIVSLNLLGEITSIQEIAEHNPKTHRMNDGASLKDGHYLVGSMAKIQPEKNPGFIYKIDKDQVKKLEKKFNIPNGFILIKEGILIADSHSKEIFLFNVFNEAFNRWTIFNSNGSPDGGCLNKKSNPIFAIWDGACLQEFDCLGKNLHKINLPVKRPTNCKYSSQENCFFVTTASEGLKKPTESELDGYLLKVTL